MEKIRWKCASTSERSPYGDRLTRYSGRNLKIINQSALHFGLRLPWFARERIGLFGAIQSGDFRTRTASLRGGSHPFRRPASAEQKLLLLTPVAKNLSC